MAINERNINSDAHFLSQLYKTEETEGSSQNLKRPFEFQVPKKILEERVKSWDSFFEKYSMEATDAVELNLETLNPEADPINEYEPERRVPMRNSIASIQYWVDTGKPPCKVYADENYNSDIGSSLSESELSVPRPAPSPPLKYPLPHPPQPANIPHEKLQRVSSVISSSSVNTREYILSATQLTSKKQSLATMESVIDSKKSAEALFNIEDTYVDVCGTDELPKILEEETHIRAASSMSNCQINELERPFILGEIFDKNHPDESGIIRVTTASLKIVDIIPSLQQIRDGPENYNCNDLYSDHLPSSESEDLIECRNINSPTTPSLKNDEPVIKVRELGRRKLFTNSQSPIELIRPMSQSSRRFSANTKLHPALVQYEVLQNQSKKKRKKSLFQPKKKLQDIGEKDEGKVNEDKVREPANNEKRKEIKEKQDQKNGPNLKDKEKIDDQRLKQIPVVKVERLSESFIQRYRHNTETEIPRKSIKKSITFSSDEDDDFATFMAHVHSPKESVSNKQSSRTCSDVRDSNEIVSDKIVTLNNLSANLKTKRSKGCDNNLTETSSRDQKGDKENNEANYEQTTLNSCRNLDNGRKFEIISSEDSSDAGNNATFSRNKRKNLKRKSSETKITNPRRSSKRNLQNSTKTASEKLAFETLKEENSHSSVNSRILVKTQSEPSIKPEKKDLENKRINGSEKAEIIETKKSLNFRRDSDSDSSLEIFDFMPRPKKETKDKVSSKTQTPSKNNLQNSTKKNEKINNLSANLNTKKSKGCDNNLTETSSRDQKGDKENNEANYEQTTLNLFRNLDNGQKCEIISSENSSDAGNNATFSRNERKSLKRNSETRSTNPRRSSKKNLQNSTKTASEKLAFETLEEENLHSSVNSRTLFKTQSEPLIKPEKKDLKNERINGSEKAEIIETKKSLIFQRDSDSDSSLEIFDFMPRPKKETKDKVSSKIQTPPKNNLQNSTKKNEKINNLSANLNTKRSKGCDNNLTETSSRDQKGDKENNEANYEQTTLNLCKNLDNGRKFEIISSENSSDAGNNATFSRNERKSLKRNSETRSTNPRRSSKKNLQNSTKTASEKLALETLEEENSHSSVNSRILFETQSEPLIKPEKKDLENKRINGSEKAEIIETEKSLIFQRDSDSDSSLEIFDFMPRPKKETKNKVSSKTQTPSKKLQNNHFRKENVQIVKKIESPLKRSSMFNKKRKKPGFGGSISSDSEENQNDLKFTDYQAKSIGTFQNGENVIKILPPKRLRREAEEISLNSPINIFGDDRSLNSSLNIFGSSNDSSEDENTFLQNFNQRLKNRRSNLNFFKKAKSGVKLQIFRTKLFSESDTD